MSFRIPTPIFTDRLIIRPYHGSDVDQYFEMSLRNKSHLLRYEASNPVMSIVSKEGAVKCVREFIDEWGRTPYAFMGAFLKGTDEFVAQVYVGLVDEDLPEFAVGYFVDERHQGHGYVTEAVRAVVDVLFQKMDAHRISSECDDTNERSINVLERCGFVREGHIRKSTKSPRGVYTGTLYYGLLENDLLNDDNE